MDMSSHVTSTMAMSTTSTATSAAVMATSTAKMSMGGMGSGSSCKISMLWNWYTVDACFIARSWHVRSAGAFAGSCIGVVLLVVLLEFLRRAQREMDKAFRRMNAAASSTAHAEETAGSSVSSHDSNKAIHSPALNHGAVGGKRPGAGTLRWWQQLLRSLVFTCQFAVGYFVMLLAMYYNGYIIICIFLGAFIGAAVFQWDTYYAGSEGPEMRDSCCN